MVAGELVKTFCMAVMLFPASSSILTDLIVQLLSVCQRDVTMQFRCSGFSIQYL
jgi:hypothetical protein